MARSRRGGGGSWQRFLGQARITRGALYLLFISAGLSLVYMLGGDLLRARMAMAFAASGEGVWHHLQLWKLATSPLLEVNFIALIFQGFALWMFLPALERWWGTKRFLLFALYTSLVGTVAGTLVGLALGPPQSLALVAGLDPFVFAGIVAYGVLFANQPVQFFGVLPMTGRQLTWGIIAFVALFVILGQQWARGAALAAAMVLAWAMTSDRISPRLWWLKSKQRRLRRHLKVVRGEGGRRGGARDEKPKRWMN